MAYKRFLSRRLFEEDADDDDLEPCFPSLESPGELPETAPKHMAYKRHLPRRVFEDLEIPESAQKRAREDLDFEPYLDVASPVLKSQVRV